MRWRQRKHKRDIGAREESAGVLGPFDEANRVGAKAFGKTRGLPFSRIREAIKINVIEVYARKWIMLNQSVARALDRTPLSSGAQHAAHERRLTATEIALQRHDHPAAQHRRKRSAGACSCGGVRQMQLDRLQRLFR